MILKISPTIFHNKSHEIRFALKWDAFYCVFCDVWLESCECTSEDDCPFDKRNRPEKPTEIIDYERARY